SSDVCSSDLSLTGFRQVTLSGAGLGTIAIDQSFTPQLQPDGITVRYRLSGAFATSGDVKASFTPGTWAYTDPAAAVAPSTLDLGDLSAQTRHGYLDVAFKPTAGTGVTITGTITAGVVSIAASGVSIDTS